MLEKLKNIGFLKIGTWKVENESLYLEYENKLTNKNALYAMVIGDEVKYVGKTSNHINKRLYQYIKPHSSQKTNKKVNYELKKEIAAGNEVDIFVYIDKNPDTLGVFSLNKAAGLEDSIIDVVNPQWNHLGKKKLNTY